MTRRKIKAGAIGADDAARPARRETVHGLPDHGRNARRLEREIHAPAAEGDDGRRGILLGGIDRMGRAELAGRVPESDQGAEPAGVDEGDGHGGAGR